MQTAVECNGSNSTTTTTTTTAPNSNIINNSLQPQPLQQPESILFNRLLAGKIHNNNTNTNNTNSTSCSISSSINNSLNNQSNQQSQESSVRAIAAQYEEFILGSPSKGAANSKPLSTTTTTTIPQVITKVIPEPSTIPTKTTMTTATVMPTTPTSNSSYNSCNSSEASTPTGTTTSAIAQNPSRSAYGGGGGADSDSNYDELLQWKDMPKYLQFNPYVLKGYRPLQTFKGCLLSLFYWHNETINILTHAIPIVYILAVVPGLMPWEKGYRFLSFCHVFGSVAPWCGSFIYHLFMNIEKGENVYYRLLKVDMVGIWVSQSFGALPLVTATTFCFTPKWKWFIIISYCLFCLWGLYKAMTASSPWQRRLCFALPFTMRSVLTFLRTMGVVGGNRIALSHVYLQDGVSVLGGAIGAIQIPEKWFPGLVDYYLNSHNIMHVLVVVAVYSMHQATIKDMEWMSATQCSSFNTTNATIYSIINSNIEL